MAVYKKTEAAIAKLSPEEYRVTQQSGTERPGTGALLFNKEPGIYVDIVSGEPLFASSDKYESGCERRAVVQVVGKVPPRRLAPHEALNRNSCRLRPGSVLAVRRSQFLKLQFHLIEEPLAPLGARVEQPKDRGP